MTNEERKALVERLEEWEWTLRAAYKGGDLGTDEPALVMGEASDQIEADGKRIAELEAALRKIYGNGDATGCNPQLKADIARAALAGDIHGQ